MHLLKERKRKKKLKLIYYVSESLDFVFFHVINMKSPQTF